MKIMQSCASDDAMKKENVDSMWTRPSQGGNGRLFMDFRDLSHHHANEGILV
jgi:hypothetical protein